jgi:hypothetical protein
MVVAVSACLAGGLALPTGAALGSHGPVLVLKSQGKAVPRGTAAWGWAGLGVCGSGEFAAGKVSVNSRPKDYVRPGRDLVSGGCGEGGPGIGGKVSTIALTSTGKLIVSGKIRYFSGDIEARKCNWTITKLEGTLALPGPTEAELSGIGTLVRHGSEAGCPASETFEGEAAIFNEETGEPFEAVLEG